MYEIKKNIPLPSRCQYPFAAMVVGDCFDVPFGDTAVATHARMSVLASGHARRHNRKYATGKIPADQVVRVWRKA